jgi:RNA polymerase sigma factor (sigma-70 family)
MSDQFYYSHLSEDENIHNCFTAYVLTALRNRKTKYLVKKSRDERKTVSLEEMLAMPEVDPALIIPCDELALILDNENTLESIICNDALLIGILKLSDRERKILNLRFIQKMKHAEIADLLGLKGKTVEKAYERLMQKLRTHMMGGDKASEEF